MMTAEQEIKEMAESKRIRQSQISKATGLDAGMISRYFSGERQMTANNYLKIKRYLEKL